MARSLGFVELVDLCGQDEIALRQAIDFVRPGGDLDFSPGKEDVWVVPLLLRELVYAVYEREGSAKIGKLEGLRMWCSSTTFQPSTCFSRAASSSLFSGGTPSRHGTHVLVARSDMVRPILALGGARTRTKGKAARPGAADTGFERV